MACIGTDLVEDSILYIYTFVIALLHGIQNDTRTQSMREYTRTISWAHTEKHIQTETHSV